MKFTAAFIAVFVIAQAHHAQALDLTAAESEVTAAATTLGLGAVAQEAMAKYQQGYDSSAPQQGSYDSTAAQQGSYGGAAPQQGSYDSTAAQQGSYGGAAPQQQSSYNNTAYDSAAPQQASYDNTAPQTSGDSYGQYNSASNQTDYTLTNTTTTADYSTTPTPDYTNSNQVVANNNSYGPSLDQNSSANIVVGSSAILFATSVAAILLFMKTTLTALFVLVSLLPLTFAQESITLDDESNQPFDQDKNLGVETVIETFPLDKNGKPDFKDGTVERSVVRFNATQHQRLLDLVMANGNSTVGNNSSLTLNTTMPMPTVQPAATPSSAPSVSNTAYRVSALPAASTLSLTLAVVLTAFW